MKKTISALLVSMFLLIPVSFAEVSGAMCPVSGEKANSKISYDYKGKTYTFCCPKCINQFKQDPEKYLAAQAAVEEAPHAH